MLIEPQLGTLNQQRLEMIKQRWRTPSVAVYPYDVIEQARFDITCLLNHITSDTDEKFLKSLGIAF